MTVSEAIAEVDGCIYNEIPREEKVLWLSRLDGVLYREVCRAHAGFEALPEPAYDPQGAGAEALVAEGPYDGLYRWYLEMHIHDANGELGKYNNAAGKFNAALQAYMNYVNRTRDFADPRRLKLI